MPSIAQISVSNPTISSPPGTKKRKRELFDHGDGENYTKLSSIQYPPHPPDLRPISINPQSEASFTSAFSPAPRTVLQPRSLKPCRSPDMKRQRILSPEFAQPRDLYGTCNTSREQDMHKSVSGSMLGVRTAAMEKKEHEKEARHESYTRNLLSPCHICHQKPKVRTDLDSYADCQWCGKRTCYICMRECAGRWDTAPWESEELDRSGSGMEDWDFEEETGYGWAVVGEGGKSPLERRQCGHRAMICSQCCVERGPDGEVSCLGCLRGETEE